MNHFLLFLFAAQCGWLLIWGLMRKGRIVELPFLFGCTLAGFALPQFIGLLNDPALPEGGLEKTLLMANLCTTALYLGYTRCRSPMRAMNWRFDGAALTFSAVALTIVGALFFFLISRLPEEMTNTMTWTGLPVAYLYFAKAMTYGLALSVLLWGGFRNRLCLVLAVIATLFYLDRILIAARRGVASEFVLVILCGIWFTRRWCPPRLAMLAFAVVAVLLVNSAADIRRATMQGASFGSILKGDSAPSAQGLEQIQYIENLKSQTTEGGGELRAAVFDIAAVDYSAEYDFGMYLWNRLVFTTVPAQLVGKETKEALTLELPDRTYAAFAYQARAGTTHTGFSDAYGSFWYFGCLLFLVIGYLMAKCYHAAVRGHLVAMILYMVMATNALHTITHGTDWFITPLPHMLIFLLPALLISRIRALPFPPSAEERLAASPAPAQP